MINWNEVDKIKADHIEDSEYYVSHKIFKIDSERAHEQRGDLLDFIDQLRPHPFNPDDRETWPEMGKVVIAQSENGTTKKVSLGEVGGIPLWIEIYGANQKFIYNLPYFKSWQYWEVQQ